MNDWQVIVLKNAIAAMIKPTEKRLGHSIVGYKRMLFRFVSPDKVLLVFVPNAGAPKISCGIKGNSFNAGVGINPKALIRNVLSPRTNTKVGSSVVESVVVDMVNNFNPMLQRPSCHATTNNAVHENHVVGLIFSAQVLVTAVDIKNVVAAFSFVLGDVPSRLQKIGVRLVNKTRKSLNGEFNRHFSSASYSFVGALCQ